MMVDVFALSEESARLRKRTRDVAETNEKGLGVVIPKPSEETNFVPLTRITFIYP